MTPLRTQSPTRRSWPFFSTPPAVFGGVMGPLVVMMAIMTGLPGLPNWIRVSAAVVVAVSIWALWRGYMCRIEATPTHVRYRTPLRRWSIPWIEVRGIAAYIPLDRNLRTRYVYITRLDDPPADRHEIDANTIQLQDRPGLVEELLNYRQAAIRTSSQADSGTAADRPSTAAKPDDFISSAHLTHGGSHP